MNEYLSQLFVAHCRYIVRSYKSFKTTKGRASFIAGMVCGILVYGLIGYGLYRLIF